MHSPQTIILIFLQSYKSHFLYVVATRNRASCSFGTRRVFEQFVRRACVRACFRVCVRACVRVRACVCTCVHGCGRLFNRSFYYIFKPIY